jgi:hypothetical protein
MNRGDVTENLFEVLKELENADYWLRRSWDKCRPITPESGLSDPQYDDLEAFTSRFARASDLLLQKVFRAIDAVELERSGTLLDAANRAEKRGIIDSVEDIRRIRELRNDISHEYLTENLTHFFQEVMRATPLLLAMISNAKIYCERFSLK